MLKLVYNADTDRRPKPARPREPEEYELVVEFHDEREIPRFLQEKNTAENE